MIYGTEFELIVPNKQNKTILTMYFYYTSPFPKTAKEIINSIFNDTYGYNQTTTTVTTPKQEGEESKGQQTGLRYYTDKKGNRVNIILGFGTIDYGSFNGYKKSDIEKAEIKDNILEVVFKKTEASSKYVVEKSHYFALPKDTNKETVSVKLEDGILSITVEEAEKEVTKVSII